MPCEDNFSQYIYEQKLSEKLKIEKASVRLYSVAKNKGNFYE